MIVAQVILASLGLFIIILGLLVWKKRCYKIVAGYVEGSTKNEEAFGKVNGIFIMIMGITTILFSFFIERLNVWVFNVSLIVLVSAQIAVNSRMARR
ncbi:DUF3784 domain-containing protein [Rossellomorea aquimaris]|uniref:DUF3784 domain-containing protein n=1 Tax=Rossellomorea aquimaris TaxID=189382 RepID=UPI001CD28F5D|nr:DUF3784 domain-containing protein [Rossellomorea aquimaris]MCA1057526.1 DUF3784 domain-containing protein [Rossellomorea aquimaris]